MIEQDDPFENRLEDYLNKGTRAIVSLVDVWGGPLGELLKTFDDPPANPHIKARSEDLNIAGSLTTFVEIAIPTLSGQVNTADLLVRELEAMGLTANAPRGRGAVGKRGLFLLDRRTTNLGRSFLAFVSDPAT